MSDFPEGVLTPLTPPAQSECELRDTYIGRARRNNELRSGAAKAHFSATAKTLGAEWGVGVGLHFELLKWLRYLVLFLMICSVPFLVVIGCSVFTDGAHMQDHTYGVKKYPPSRIHSLTFAAIVDDSIDNGTLQYMNTEMGHTWRGPMHKSTFLIWISLADAGALLLFCCGLVGLWYHLRRFAEHMDRTTLEAADYTVLVRGLPHNADAAEVGAHFSRYGEVMDVVLVTDRLSSTLHHCGRAARLQQKRAMVLDAAAVRSGGDAHLSKLTKLDERLGCIAEDIRDVAERRQRVRAAFVTFNTENERRACTAQCPNSWLGSLLQARPGRYLQRCRFWARRAAAPEDYKLEHLAVAEWQLAGRELFVWVVTLLLVLLCAAVITKLTDVSNAETSTTKWLSTRLSADASAAVFTTNTTIPSTASTTSSASASSISGLVTGRTPPTSLPAACSAALSGTCNALLAARFNNTVYLEYGHTPTWNNTMARLLYERPVRTALQDCAYGQKSGSGSGSEFGVGGHVVGADDECGLAACLPCVCLGLSRNAAALVRAAARNEAQQLCEPYVNELDVKSWGIRLSISVVVAVLNSAIKWLLQGLVLLGRHWTHTARERSYALQCFLAMLVNTVAVLLLTNCESLGKVARESEDGTWFRYFVRYGAYDDFTALWYENVGLSIMILMVINCASPLLTLVSDEAWQALLRCRVRSCMAVPLQADYDQAWARPRFTLEQRTADLLLNAALALLFGSGMPLVYLVLVGYLVISELADRWALTRQCGESPRYSKGLMRLVMGLLPWLAVAHCAFGLWMHTYFRVVPPEEGTSGADVAQMGAAVRATNARLSAAGEELSALQSSGTWQRITQPNGLALLLLCVLLALWLLFGRYILWRLLSCTGRAIMAACCPHSPRLLRLQLDSDTAATVYASTYSEALVNRDLHGTPTYRLAHHPHYTQYFAASGLNRAVGMAALVAAAASGGAGRHIYTRLKTIRRRGRLPGGASFQILPVAVTDPAAAGEGGGSSSSLAASNTSKLQLIATTGGSVASEAAAAAVAAAAAAAAAVSTIEGDSCIGDSRIDDSPCKPLRDYCPDSPTAKPEGERLAPPGAVLTPSPGGYGPKPQAAMIRGPDVWELLRQEEAMAAAAAAALGSGTQEGEGTDGSQAVAGAAVAVVSAAAAATAAPVAVAGTPAESVVPATASCVVYASGGGRLFGATALRIEVPGEPGQGLPGSLRGSNAGEDEGSEEDEGEVVLAAAVAALAAAGQGQQPRTESRGSGGLAAADQVTLNVRA